MANPGTPGKMVLKMVKMDRKNESDYDSSAWKNLQRTILKVSK